MRKNVILFIVTVSTIFVSLNCIAASNIAFGVPNPIYTGYAPEYDYIKLEELENDLYEKTYPKDSLIARIERLESSVYNQYYSNYPIEQRLSNLIHNYNYRKQNRYSRVNKIKRLVNGINSAFWGVPTGVTPPISDPNYGGSGLNNGNYYYGNNGFRYYNNNVNSGFGVKILD